MLSKLMKHELRATKRTVVPAILLLLAASLGARFGLTSFMDSNNEALILLGSLLTVAYAIFTVGLLIACAVLMVVRFYKNMMGDEGYLMFTLPVSIHQHIWSKLLISTLWMVLCGIAVLVSAFLLIAGYDIDFGPVVTEIRRLLQTLFQTDEVTLLILTVISGLLRILVGFTEAYAAISVGCSRPNAKILWSFLVFIAFQFASSFLSGLLPLDIEMGRLASNLISVYLCNIMVLVLQFIIFYAVTVYFTKMKLNLE